MLKKGLSTLRLAYALAAPRHHLGRLAGRNPRPPQRRNPHPLNGALFRPLLPAPTDRYGCCPKQHGVRTGGGYSSVLYSSLVFAWLSFRSVKWPVSRGPSRYSGFRNVLCVTLGHRQRPGDGLRHCRRRQDGRHSDRRRRTFGRNVRRATGARRATVNIFDEHLAWEKPCGGGLTHKAIQCFPFLLDNPYPKKLVHSVELISSNDHRATLDMPHPIVIYSRTVLNGMLLNRAAGSRLQSQSQSHVFSVDTRGAKPRFCVEGEWRTADFLVLAGGARNHWCPRRGRCSATNWKSRKVISFRKQPTRSPIKFLPQL